MNFSNRFELQGGFYSSRTFRPCYCLKDNITDKKYIIESYSPDQVEKDAQNIKNKKISKERNEKIEKILNPNNIDLIKT